MTTGSGTPASCAAQQHVPGAADIGIQDQFILRSTFIRDRRQVNDRIHTLHRPPDQRQSRISPAMCSSSLLAGCAGISSDRTVWPASTTFLTTTSQSTRTTRH